MSLETGPAQYLVLLVALLRIVEMIHARANTRRLLAEGGVEHGAGHYPLFILLHGAWLLTLFLAVPPTAPVNGWLLTVFALLLAARVWTIASLGRYWTTRVITLADRPLVHRGPYRWLRHPNYLVVALEIAVLPLVFGAWEIALVFSLLNAGLLRHRIRVEEAALAGRRRAS